MFLATAVHQCVGPCISTARLLERIRLGPLAQVVYWSVLHSDHLGAARRTRCAVTGRMGALFFSQWRTHGHVSENFSSHRNHTECTSDLLDSWGALACLVLRISG